MNRNLLLFAALILLISCKKKGDPTVQDLLDKGTEVSVILEDYPADSLLGKSFEGGWIFYVEEAKGMVRIVSDVSFGEQVVWGCAGNPIQGADSLGVGYGKWNTEDIIAECSDPGAAAGSCYYSNHASFTDWVLPSAEEMYFVYENLHSKGIGNFSGGKYWTSTEESATQAVHVSFDNGVINFSNKTTFLHIRGIRQSS